MGEGLKRAFAAAKATRKKPASCRWCKAGHVANADGEHWIVKSVIPARMSIMKCTAVAPASQPGGAPHG